MAQEKVWYTATVDSKSFGRDCESPSCSSVAYHTVTVSLYDRSLVLHLCENCSSEVDTNTMEVSR